MVVSLNPSPGASTYATNGSRNASGRAASTRRTSRVRRIVAALSKRLLTPSASASASGVTERLTYRASMDVGRQGGALAGRPRPAAGGVAVVLPAPHQTLSPPGEGDVLSAA